MKFLSIQQFSRIIPWDPNWSGINYNFIGISLNNRKLQMTNQRPPKKFLNSPEKISFSKTFDGNWNEFFFYLFAISLSFGLHWNAIENCNYGEKLFHFSSFFCIWKWSIAPTTFNFFAFQPSRLTTFLV